jgi:hypothetical protein
MELRIKKVIRNAVFVSFSTLLHLRRPEPFPRNIMWKYTCSCCLLALLHVPSQASGEETCKLEITTMGIAVCKHP